MNANLAAWVFLLCCAGLCYTGFCRLVHMSPRTTDPTISTALWGMSVAACFGVFAVLWWGYVPGWPPAILAAAMLAVQVATSKAWRDGLPPGYRRQS
jgi:hypothetical protein